MEEESAGGRVKAVNAAGSTTPVPAGADTAAADNMTPALKNESVITEDMVIDGSVRTKSNLRILGQISGDVRCEGALLLAGKVIGDVYADSMRVQSGNITGNIQVTDEMVVDNNSWIKGDITSGRLMFNGHSEGNMMVQESIELRESERKCILGMYFHVQWRACKGNDRHWRPGRSQGRIAGGKNHGFFHCEQGVLCKDSRRGLWQASG